MPEVTHRVRQLMGSGQLHHLYHRNHSMSNLTLILLLLAVGMTLRRIPAFPETTAQVLNQYVIHISLPAMVLALIPSLKITTDLAVPVIMPWIMLLLSVALIQVLSHHRGWSRETTGCLMLIVPLGNTSFLGIPMIEALFGDDWVPYGILYDQTGSFLALSTYGSLVVTLYQPKLQQKFSLSAIVQRILTFPPFIALITALIAGPFIHHIPIVQETLHRIADTLVPIVMVAVGFNFSPRLPKHYVGPLVTGLGIKMILAPAIALGLCLSFNVMTPPAIIAIFEAGMPPMITAGAIAAASGLAVELATTMVGLGILSSLVLLPLLAMILNGLS